MGGGISGGDYLPPPACRVQIPAPDYLFPFGWVGHVLPPACHGCDYCLPPCRADYRPFYLPATCLPADFCHRGLPFLTPPAPPACLGLPGMPPEQIPPRSPAVSSALPACVSGWNRFWSGIIGLHFLEVLPQPAVLPTVTCCRRFTVSIPLPPPSRYRRSRHPYRFLGTACTIPPACCLQMGTLLYTAPIRSGYHLPAPGGHLPGSVLGACTCHLPFLGPALRVLLRFLPATQVTCLPGFTHLLRIPFLPGCHVSACLPPAPGWMVWSRCTCLPATVRFCLYLPAVPACCLPPGCRFRSLPALLRFLPAPACLAPAAARMPACHCLPARVWVLLDSAFCCLGFVLDFLLPACHCLPLPFHLPAPFLPLPACLPPFCRRLDTVSGMPACLRYLPAWIAIADYWNNLRLPACLPPARTVWSACVLERFTCRSAWVQISAWVHRSATCACHRFLLVYSFLPWVCRSFLEGPACRFWFYRFLRYHLPAPFCHLPACLQQIIYDSFSAIRSAFSLDFSY